MKIRMILAISLLFPTLLLACGGGGDSSDTAEPTTISVSGAFALFPLMTI